MLSSGRVLVAGARVDERRRREPRGREAVRYRDGRPREPGMLWRDQRTGEPMKRGQACCGGVGRGILSSLGVRRCARALAHYAPDLGLVVGRGPGRLGSRRAARVDVDGAWSDTGVAGGWSGVCGARSSRGLVLSGSRLCWRSLVCRRACSRASAAATPAVPAFAPVPGSTFTTGVFPESVAFSPSGKLLATANLVTSATSPTSDRVGVLGRRGRRADPGDRFAVRDRRAGPDSMAFSPSGGLLATANAETAQCRCSRSVPPAR